jgi:hypothetical protein
MRHETAEHGSTRRVDPDHLPCAVELGQFDLIGPDEAATDEVDEMTRQEVLPEEELAWSALESPQVDPLTFKVDVTRIETSHLADRDEQVAPFDFDDESHDGGMGGISHSGDEVLHPAEAVTSPVDERALDDVGKVDDLYFRAGNRLLSLHVPTVCLAGSPRA